jgi:outer membrane protein
MKPAAGRVVPGLVALLLCGWSAGATGVNAGGAAPPGAPERRIHALNLDEAIALAFARNPDMGAAAERIGEAQARVGEATAAFLPHVSTDVTFARTDNPAQAFAMILNQRRLAFSPSTDFNNPGPTQDVRPEVVGRISLFRGGQDYERRAAAQARVAAARYQRDAVRNGLADAVIAAYYALLAAPEQVAATRASIDAVDRALAEARLRYAAGTVLKADVLSLQVRLAAAREANLRARNAVELARTGLRILLALPADAPVTVAPEPAARTADLPATLDEARRQALAHRPEIQAAARLVAMRAHEVKAERAAYFPRIDAIATYGQDSADFALSRSKENWTVGATAAFDLFSGFRTAERVRAAERRLAEAREAQRKTQLGVERDVNAAMLTLNEARQEARVTQAAVAAAEEALRLVQQQYQAGAVIVTRYLEAEAARTDARSHAIAARYEARRAEGGLEQAIGYWATLDAAAPGKR